LQRSLEEMAKKTAKIVEQSKKFGGPKGTEAAAATAVTWTVASIEKPKPKPIEVKVDRPFLYASQHVPSGACLSIGRVTDPR